MDVRLKPILRKLSWLDRIFLAAFAAAFAGSFVNPVPDWELLLTFAAFVLGVAVAFRWMIFGVRKLMWRLRYRLIVAYLFIAVVPILLIMTLVLTGGYILAGQIAAYMVTAELERLSSSLMAPARGLAWTPPDRRTQYADWLTPAFWTLYPGFEAVIRDKGVWRYPAKSTLQPPPAGWPEVSGIVRKDGVLYLWAHAVRGATDVTMLVPLTQRTIRQVVPNIGELSFIRRQTGAQSEKLPDDGDAAPHVPAAANVLDREVLSASLLPVAVWESPGAVEKDALFLNTRYSAVLRTIFGQTVEWQPGETISSLAVTISIVVGTVFLIVELVSVIIGIRLTRTITRAVHNLYEGTQRIRVGDFSHSIDVHGDDQLAELSGAFNHMTEDLERLVDVAKEKERLQSEIEIAREVQNQLFPKDVPVSNTLELAASCLPARLVSGDYYDYLALDDARLALAIGDVAGKGISAALLMATVQSTMRTQLRAGRERAVAAGNGGPQVAASTATLVSRLNQQLFAFTPPEKFATFYFALYDDATGLMTYTNAGHLPPILVRRGTPSRLEVTGTVVGAFSFAEYGESTLRTEPGDLLVCFTDGVTEPENEFGEMFGEDRLTDVVVKHAACDSAEIIAAVTESVRHWTGSPELQDDMTLLLARRV